MLLLHGLLVFFITQSILTLIVVRVHTFVAYQNKRDYECVFLLNQIKQIKEELQATSKEDTEDSNQETKVVDEDEKSEESLHFSRVYKYHQYDFVFFNDVIQVQKEGKQYFEATLDSETKCILTYQYLDY